MTDLSRPRVAAIKLDSPQFESIAPLCGDLRRASALGEYVQEFNWTETDVVVSSGLHSHYVDGCVNLMTIGPSNFYWSDSYSGPAGRIKHRVRTDNGNTERELAVSPTCPGPYKLLAAELTRQLSLSGEPPTVVSSSRLASLH